MKTVLVIDDFASVRLYHMNLLKQAGFKAIPACDGAEALERLKTESVDLILLDMVMPGMDGRQFLKQLRAETSYASLPVLVISGELPPEELESLKNPGPLIVLMKPVLPAAFLQEVKKIMLGSQGGAAQE